MPVPRAAHPAPEDLVAFAAGKLPDADAGAVAAHLVSCPDCRRAAEKAHGDSLIARLTAGVPDPSSDTRLPASSSPGALSLNPPPELAAHPRYRILRELGRGGMGVVYLAQQTLMNRQVVIKVINKALLDQPDALERFRREIEAAAKLAHPNIVTAHDAEQAGDLHMLVMEYVEGQSLDQVLRRKGPLPVMHSCVYARQAALGLQHAFERGMVHRDIKPHNLMLTPKGQVKILDFGLAKVVSENRPQQALTALNAYMGTPDYSAPEQATDARAADIRADIYSLGCTLYCLLAGRPPFQEETAVQTILAHLEKEPTPLPELRHDVPAALWQVVARMLAKDPAQRFQKPAEVAQALLPFIKPGQKMPAPPPGVASPGRGTMVATETGRLPSAVTGPSVTPRRVAAPEASPLEDIATTTPRRKKARKGRPASAAGFRKRWPLLAGVGGAAVLGLVVLLAVVLRLKTQDGIVTLENVQADAEVFVDGRKVTVTIPGNQEPVRVEVPEGQHQLKVTTGTHEVIGEQVTVRWGKADPLKITLGPEVAGSGHAGAPAPKAAAGKVRAYKHGDGKWRVEGDELLQEDANANLAIVVFGDSSWADYDVTVEAQRIKGMHLCSVPFRVESLLDFWNFLVFADTRRIGTRVDGTAKPVQSKGWTVDNAWHKLGVKVQGERIQCLMDEELIFDLGDGRHPRGGVALTVGKTATRFRNLKVTDASGRVLVDGVRSLEWAAEQGDPGTDDAARAGTVWRGKWRQNVDGKDIPDQDALLKIRKRAGTKFEGEYWAINETIGLKIGGTIDGLGNISWRATAILAGTIWAPNILDVLFMGAIKGKQLRAYGYFGGPRNLIAEVILSRDD